MTSTPAGVAAQAASVIGPHLITACGTRARPPGSDLTSVFLESQRVGGLNHTKSTVPGVLVTIFILSVLSLYFIFCCT